MSEYISRDAAIGRLDELERTAHHNSVLWPDHVEECREALRDVPAADVRPVRRGKWIQRKNWTRCVCSACSWEITFVTGNSYNFCPNCGADMREES